MFSVVELVIVVVVPIENCFSHITVVALGFIFSKIGKFITVVAPAVSISQFSAVPKLIVIVICHILISLCILSDFDPQIQTPLILPLRKVIVYVLVTTPSSNIIISGNICFNKITISKGGIGNPVIWRGITATTLATLIASSMTFYYSNIQMILSIVTRTIAIGFGVFPGGNCGS